MQPWPRAEDPTLLRCAKPSGVLDSMQQALKVSDLVLPFLSVASPGSRGSGTWNDSEHRWAGIRTYLRSSLVSPMLAASDSANAHRLARNLS